MHDADVEKKVLKTGEIGYVTATVQHAHVHRRSRRDAHRRQSAGTTTATGSTAKHNSASMATSAATLSSPRVPSSSTTIDQGTQGRAKS